MVPLTQPQKAVLGRFMTNRDNNTDDDDCIVIPHVGSGGKSKRYIKVPKTQVGSGDAAKRTKNIRSKFMEKIEQIMSTSKNKMSGVHPQRVNNIPRDKEGYAAAVEEAGLKIITKLSRETVLSLRSVMTLRMWRVLKRIFTDEVGWDIFGSVAHTNLPYSLCTNSSEALKLPWRMRSLNPAAQSGEPGS